jgi:flagellar protein FliS
MPRPRRYLRYEARSRAPGNEEAAMGPGSAYSRAGAYQSVAAWSSVAEDEPQKLIVKLYDGALERIAAARGCIANGLVAEKCELLTRVLAIVGELRGSLDLVRGGDIAAHLDDLYDYVSRQLLLANATNRVDLLDEVSSLLRELRSAWTAVAGMPGRQG